MVRLLISHFSLVIINFAGRFGKKVMIETIVSGVPLVKFYTVARRDGSYGLAGGTVGVETRVLSPRVRGFHSAHYLQFYSHVSRMIALRSLTSFSVNIINGIFIVNLLSLWNRHQLPSIIITLSPSTMFVLIAYADNCRIIKILHPVVGISSEKCYLTLL